MKNIMNGKNIKKTIYISVLIIFTVLLVSCETEPPQPTNPIFSDVEKVEISRDGNNFIFSDIPSYVKYMQVYIFDTDPSGYIDDNNKLIKNLSTILIAGNRTDLAGGGLSRSSVTTFYTPNPEYTDFTSTVIAVGSFSNPFLDCCARI